MKSLLAMAAACCAMWAVQVQAQDGGFGLRMGQPISQLNITERVNPYMMWISVPKPNGEFKSYLAIATSQDGLCKVAGLGVTYKSDSYGTQGRSSFNKFRSILSEKYGTSKDFDFIKSDAIWDKPRDFAMALKEDERYLDSFWTRDEGANLPSHLHTISLRLQSVASDSTYLVLNYEFANFPVCKTHFDKADTSGL